MTCCGRKHSTLHAAPPQRARQIATTVPKERSPASPVQSGGTVAVRSVVNSAIVVRGSATGRHYAFTTAAPVQLVEARDAATLLRTRWFHRA
ncbi:hypothetical protein OKW35_000457 [Paraburkholderia sp. MM5477-R1]